MTAPARLGAGRHIEAGARPTGSTTTVHELPTADGAKVNGVLTTVPGAATVVCLMHPRNDLTHHPLVPVLLGMGVAVWTQGARSTGNDLSLVHEQALVDVAAGMTFLRDRGLDKIVTLGHSGGGALYTYYAEQSGLAASEREPLTPGGRPNPLVDAHLPTVDGHIYLAPHPGQGRLLLGCIDPSVADEDDPLSVVDELNPFAEANGFAEPPASARYGEEFLDSYRAAQEARVARIDGRAREYLADAAEARKTFKTSNDPADRRRSLAPRIMTVHRTDADPRTVDLSLDPNERPYGSVFGRRPDLTNYGLVGFCRLTTPEAWLSTWSGLSSRADFVRCAPGVSAPTLFVELTGDQAAFPADSRRMRDALGSTDRTEVEVRGTHFGGPVAKGEPTGNELAGSEIQRWLADRFPLA